MPSRRGRHARVALREPPLLARIGPERDQRADEEDAPGEPDQVDERGDVHLEGDTAVAADLVGDHEQVLPGPPVAPNAHLVGDLALGAVAVLPGLERPERAAVPRDPDDGPPFERVRAFAHGEPLVRQRVRTHVHGLARAELGLTDRVVGARPGHADREQDYGRVNDVTPIAAAVPGNQRAQTRRTNTRRGPGSSRRPRAAATPARRAARSPPATRTSARASATRPASTLRAGRSPSGAAAGARTL